MTKETVKPRRARGKGETAEVEWDLAQVAKEKEQAARALFRLLDMPGLPPFVSEALYMMLNHAADVKGACIGDDSARGYSVKAVATLFAITSGVQPELRFKPAPRDFAELLSSVLNHPDCPGELYDAIGDCDCLQIRRWDTPAALRLALGTREQIEAPRPSRRADDLAQKLADIIADPATPEEIKEGIERGASDLFNRLVHDTPGDVTVYNTPGYLRALVAHPEASKGAE